MVSSDGGCCRQKRGAEKKAVAHKAASKPVKPAKPAKSPSVKASKPPKAAKKKK